MDDAEFIERYLILLIGVKNSPIPSNLHIQKELFLLSNFKRDIAESFDFVKHYFGPYSQVLNDALKNPAYFSDAFYFEDKKISLTANGKKEFIKMVANSSKDIDFQILLSSFNLLRGLYDNLSEQEFMFLIYETYPQYMEMSEISDKLLKNKNIRNKLIENIFSKGLITEEKYLELKNAK